MRIELLNPDNGGAGYYVAQLEEPDTSPIWGWDWYPDIDIWCETTFGQEDLWGQEPLSGWKRMRNKYFFVEENQLTCFILRWL